MRIVDRRSFLTLPTGTIYAKGDPFAFGGIMIKGDSFGESDWWCLDPCSIEAHDSGELFERMEKMLGEGASYPMESAEARDGCYEADAIFLVFEHDDLVRLRAMIDTAISVAS